MNKKFLIPVISILTTALIPCFVWAAATGYPSTESASPDDGTQVYVRYDESYRTKHYKCWDEVNGELISGSWDGITDNYVEQGPTTEGLLKADNVKNAAVVRRGTTAYIKSEIQGDITIWAPSETNNRKSVDWKKGQWSNGEIGIEIPADASVGDYQIQVGNSPENYVTLYVIFDTYLTKDVSNGLDDNQFRSWAYDDTNWKETDDSKNYLNYVFYLSDYKYFRGFRGMNNKELDNQADGGVFGQRMVEIAMSIHGSNTKTPLEAAVHSYKVIGQRFKWKIGESVSFSCGYEKNTFDKFLQGVIYKSTTTETKRELDVVAAKNAALNDNKTLSEDYVFENVQCMNHATNLTAMLRAMGIPSRVTSTIKGAGWNSGYHCWVDAVLGTPQEYPMDTSWSNGIWWKLDSCYPSSEYSSAHIEGNIAPLAIDGWGDYLLNEYKNTALQTVLQKNYNCVILTENTNNSCQDDSLDMLEIDGMSSLLMLANLKTDYANNDYSVNVPIDNVVNIKNGYVLNSSQMQIGESGGIGFSNNTIGNDDVPELIVTKATEISDIKVTENQAGIVSGMGFMMYRIPVKYSYKTTIKLTSGKENVKFYATLDRQISAKNNSSYTSPRRFNLDYDLESDENGEITFYATDENGNIRTIKNIYVFIELKGLKEDLQSPNYVHSVGLFNIQATKYYHGDVNDDNTIDSADYTKLRQYLLDINKDINTANADLNMDGVIDSADYILLKGLLINNMN